jgi:hypothetical protein
MQHRPQQQLETRQVLRGGPRHRHHRDEVSQEFGLAPLHDRVALRTPLLGCLDGGARDRGSGRERADQLAVTLADELEVPAVVGARRERDGGHERSFLTLVKPKPSSYSLFQQGSVCLEPASRRQER